MYRNLSLALLVAAFGLIANHTGGLPATAPTSPLIVRRVGRQNLTAAIPTTTLLTPTQNGLFRLSVYMTQSVAQPPNVWMFNLNWTDDAGAETSGSYGLLWLQTAQTPPRAWASNAGVDWPGNVMIFQAVAGQPITYTVTDDAPAGTYSFYLTLERLI